MSRLKIKINSPNQIIKRLGLDENGGVTLFLRNEVDRLSDPYVPFASGSGVHMKSNKTYPSNHEIKYNAPYSHYHYMGKKAVGPSRPAGVKRQISGMDMKYQGAPFRGPKWDKRMMADRKDDVIKSVQNYIKSGGK